MAAKKKAVKKKAAKKTTAKKSAAKKTSPTRSLRDLAKSFAASRLLRPWRDLECPAPV